MAKPPKPPRTLRRRFITPEGVDLQIELGTAGARAAGFLLDTLMQLGILITLTIALAYLLRGGKAQAVLILWMLGAFALRNGWFILWEMGGRGATPGKRIAGLRVIARDGARLTGGAVIARNAVREMEVFLPLSYLLYQAFQHGVDWLVTLFSLAWTGIFLFFPLFNRDRLRVGDLIAGTWVVRNSRAKLGADLVAHRPAVRRVFSDAALSLYGEYELQTLEQVLRGGQPESIKIVADTIRWKAGIPPDWDDYGFLSEYYVALCAKLERGMLLGQRRPTKFDAPRSPMRVG